MLAYYLWSLRVTEYIWMLEFRPIVDPLVKPSSLGSVDHIEGVGQTDFVNLSMDYTLSQLPGHEVKLS